MCKKIYIYILTLFVCFYLYYQEPRNLPDHILTQAVRVFLKDRDSVSNRVLSNHSVLRQHLHDKCVKCVVIVHQFVLSPRFSPVNFISIFVIKIVGAHASRILAFRYAYRVQNIVSARQASNSL